MKNFIYVIGASDGPQKIGVAVDVKKRLQGIQTGSHLPVTLASAEAVEADVAIHVENYAHWILREQRLSGEWFRVTPEQAKQAVHEAVEAVAKGERKERVKRAKVGRPRLWAEDMQARFAEGTFARIDAVKGEKEDRTDFIREAVERELKRRERKS
jgi:T5orf172 domain